jgi:hypothetical protein
MNRMEKTMDKSTIEYWLPEEYSAGLCSENEVGKIKPPLLEARRLAQRATSKAIKALVEVAEQSDDLQAKTKAAQVLLDRGWGRAELVVAAPSGASVVEFPAWITARRLAYQESAQVAQDVLSKPVDAPVEQAKQQAWKPTDKDAD